MQVHTELTKLDGEFEKAFTGREPNEKANLADLDLMIDRLAAHFWKSERTISDLSDSVRNNLVVIFDTMAEYYAYQEGMHDPN